MSDTGLDSSALDDIAAKGLISSEDVLRLRREVFKDGIVDRSEAEAVFRLDRACSDKDPTWAEFYVDALTDYFVWQAEPAKYVSDDKARLLIENIVRDGCIDSATELALLIKIINCATSCPETLVIFVLDAVSESVLNPDRAAYGAGRRPKLIDEMDVEIIRTVIYSGASGGGFTVTRREAELLFDLNDATVEAENAPGWRDLFVKAIANHLMFPLGAPSAPDAGEASRREDWLKERPGTGGLLKGIGRALAGGDIDFGGAWNEVDGFGRKRSRQEIAREEAQVREALSREAIDEDEANWLIGRVCKDRVLHENERALLAFIKENAPNTHPALNQLFVKAGL